MPRKVARLYPNGEFSIWMEDERLDISDAPEPDPLGLSTLPNSHKAMLGLPVPKERERQGLGGISSYGARMVRNACYLLQKTYRRECLSFLTCTLPPLPSGKILSPAQWSEITRQLVQTVRRQLRAAGLPGSIVGVTEIQMERWLDEGGMPLHLHLLFQGRKPYQKGWTINTFETDIIWMRACMNAEPEFEGVSFKAACKIHKIEKSAEGYMGKYLSKGKKAVDLVVSHSPHLAGFLPSAWWICSTNLKRAIKSRVKYGTAIAERVTKWSRNGEPYFAYWRDIFIPVGDNPRAIHSVVGKLCPNGRQAAGLHSGGTNVLLAHEGTDDS